MGMLDGYFDEGEEPERDEDLERVDRVLRRITAGY